MAFPTITVRVAWASNAFAASPTWNEITGDVQELSIIRGRQHELDRIKPAKATVKVINLNGNYWPDNTGGSYYPNIKPGKRINIRATYNAITYDLFTGFIETFKYKWRSAMTVPEVEITAVDLQKNLGLLKLNKDPGYSQELSSARVNNVLDDLGWPAANRNINTGQSNMIASGIFTNVDAISHLYTVIDSELGRLFIEGDGDARFLDRHALLKSPYLTSQAIFGDDAGELGIHDARPLFDDIDIYNDVRIQRSGGAEKTASDTPSQNTFGKRTLSRTGLFMTTDLETQDQANYLLSRFKDPSLRLKEIIIKPMGDEANLFPQVLGRELQDRITVRIDPASLAKDYHIEGIEQRVKGKDWATLWQLVPADALEYWTLGTSQLGTGTRLAY